MAENAKETKGRLQKEESKKIPKAGFTSMSSRVRSAATMKLPTPCDITPTPRVPHNAMWCPRPCKKKA